MTSLFLSSLNVWTISQDGHARDSGQVAVWSAAATGGSPEAAGGPRLRRHLVPGWTGGSANLRPSYYSRSKVH